MNYKAFTLIEKPCALCGARYFLGPFDFNGGTCKKCSPQFLSAPLSLRAHPAGTLALWKLQILIHGLFVVLFGMLLDGGEISNPGMIYCLTIVSYFTVKIWKGKGSKRGFPVLSGVQRLLLVLLFVWGNLEFHFIFQLTQSLKGKF